MGNAFSKSRNFRKNIYFSYHSNTFYIEQMSDAINCSFCIDTYNVSCCLSHNLYVGKSVRFLNLDFFIYLLDIG